MSLRGRHFQSQIIVFLSFLLKYGFSKKIYFYFLKNIAHTINLYFTKSRVRNSFFKNPKYKNICDTFVLRRSHDEHKIWHPFYFGQTDFCKMYSMALSLYFALSSHEVFSFLKSQYVYFSSVSVNRTSKNRLSEPHVTKLFFNKYSIMKILSSVVDRVLLTLVC